jgi:type I site-specific restriction-modification system R (restriction) subunit
MVKNDEEVYMEFTWNIQQQTVEHVEDYYECMLKVANCIHVITTYVFFTE